MAEKFDDLLGVKCDSVKKAALERVAKARGVEAAEMVRQAINAILEYAQLYGDKRVPLDMAIAQRRHPENELALAAEETSSLHLPHNLGQGVLHPAMEEAQKTPDPVPQGPRELPPAAEGKRAKK